MKKIIFCFVFFLFYQSYVHSNNLPLTVSMMAVLDDYEDDGGGPPVEDPSPPAPIDDWIPVLVLLGVAYTGYFFYKKKPLKSN